MPWPLFIHRLQSRNRAHETITLSVCGDANTPEREGRLRVVGLLDLPEGPALTLSFGDGKSREKLRLSLECAQLPREIADDLCIIEAGGEKCLFRWN